MNRAWLVAMLVGATAAAAERPFDVTADHVEASGLTERGEVGEVHAAGDVRARSGPLLLRAPELTYDRAHRLASATGGVTGVDGALVFEAKSLSFDLATDTLSLQDGRLFVKRGVAAAELERLELSSTPEAARAQGGNALSLRASSIARLDANRFRATDAWLTTCDCAENETPLLAVTAREVDFVPDDVATLRGWTFELHGVRLPFTLPIPLSFPLASRRSGLLFPRLALGGPGGIALELPYFVTLGRSWDLTLRARWFAGNASANSRSDATLGIRGVGGEAELRWRPAIDAAGSLVLTGLDDTSIHAQGRGGARGEVLLRHDEGLLGGRLAVRADVVSDSAYLLDTTLALARAELPYLVDEAAFTRATGGFGLALSSSVLQALHTFPIASPSAVERFSLADAPATVAPVGQLSLGDVLSAGPLMLDSAATLAFEAPTPGLDLAPGRSRRLAAELALGQTLPVAHGRFGSVALETGERAQGFSSPEVAPFGRLGAFAELRAESRVARTFASGWTHDVVPSVRVRGFWTGGGAAFADSVYLARDAGLPPTSALRPPQSVLDVALFPDRMVQAIARVATSLSKDGATPATLYVEHHVALLPLEAGELVAGFTGELPKSAFSTRLDLAAAWNANDHSLADASARITARPLGGLVGAGARYLGATGSDELGRPLDLLFTPHDLRVALATSTPLVQGDVELSFPATTSLKLGAGALVAKTLPTAAGSTSTFTQQYWASLAYDAGGCARFTAALRWTPVAGQPTTWPVASFSFELGDFTHAAAAVDAGAL